MTKLDYRVTILLGLSIPGSTDAVPPRKVAAAVGDAFPDGFSMTAQTGGWRDIQTGEVIFEDSLAIVVYVDADGIERARALAATLRRVYRQQAVGFVVERANLEFV